MSAISSLFSLTLTAMSAPHVTTVYLPDPAASGRHLALHCATPDVPVHRGVLFIHGSSFPTMLASGFEFAPGDSWIDYMASQGFLSCGLDFMGFGASSRPDEMAQPPAGKEPVLRAPEAAQEIAAAIKYLRDTRGVTEIHVVAHSWGTIPAAAFAATQPRELSSLTLFGPVVPIPGSKQEPVQSSWWSITAQERLSQLRYASILPAGLVLLEPAVADKWAARFAASTPQDPGDEPGAIRIPSGPVADIGDARAGLYPYSRDKVTVPILAVYGNYDSVADTEDTAAFLARFTSSPLKWQLRIDSGTHVMHLERNRRSLYESVLGFIRTAAALHGQPFPE